MTWFITNAARLASERAQIDELALHSGWLEPRGWRLDDKFRLTWDADLLVGTIWRPISLQYPGHFPHAPPSVLPRDAAERWSGHQYGTTGELCLERGPDNWESHFTGADMVQSAYRLLSSEHPDENGVVVGVLSRHQTTLGQNLRAEYLRILQTSSLIDRLAEMAVGETATGEVRSSMMTDAAWISMVRSIKTAEGQEWLDPEIPKQYDNASHKYAMLAIRVSTDHPGLVPDAEGAFRSAFESLCGNPLGIEENYVAILVRDSDIRAYYVLGKKAYIVTPIPAEPRRSRLPDSHSDLSGKRVALVGCGSVGSKIASALARAGVDNFFLVDDDVFLPENIVRHDLDWAYVGQHKANAMSTRLGLMHPNVQCQSSRLRLAGQEASGGFGEMLTNLADCDLIIDATAEPRVFNLLSAVVSSKKKPMVWAAVYAGGIGGLIARHRPEVDPSPQSIRRQIEDWCVQQGVAAPPMATKNYSADSESGPLVAGDAEVAIIAAHAARLVIDTLLRPFDSAFPSSVYLIGLQQEWIFTAPFDTIPITVSGPTGAPSEVSSQQDTQAAVEFLMGLLPEGKNETPSAQKVDS